MFIQGQFIRIPGGAYAQMRFSYNHYGLWRDIAVLFRCALWRLLFAGVTDVAFLSYMFIK